MAFEDWFLQRSRIASKQHKNVSMDDKMTFFQQLAVLVSSGTPILQSLKTAAQQCQSTRLRAILDEVAGRVAAGCSLHTALSNHRNIFEDHWVELIGTGEVSGKMSQVLCDLNEQIRESRETRRKVNAALMYPIILAIVAVLVVIIMLWFVVPTFGKMFEEMDAELPSITQFVMSASQVIVQYGIFVVVGVVILAVAFGRCMNTDTGRRRVGAIGLATPLIGDLMVQSAMYRFSSNLALLLNSGVPMLDTLSTLATVFRTTPPYRDSFIHARNRVAAGRPLADSLDESGLFTAMMVNMVRTGEESAQLAAVMAQIAPYYREKLNGFISRITKLLEPCIIMFMGVTIAIIMLAIYIPMFEMSGHVK